MYFDYAATSPMRKEALAVYLEAAQHFPGNTSSPHDEGSKANFLLQRCRGKIAQKAGVCTDGIYFTGSGTEGNVLAILSMARNRKGKHIITSMAEHTSVHSAMTLLEMEGFDITRLPLNEKGIVSAEDVQKSIRPDTVLISIQHVNPEIGTIQPVEKVAIMAKDHGVLFHTDCVQSFGKLDVTNIKADAMTFSAHKMGGPKGCGAVYLSPYTSVTPVFPGMTHEKGIRGGTVDTPAVAAFAEAAQLSVDLERLSFLRHLLKKELEGTMCRWIEADEAQQFPGVIGMCIPGIEGQLIMLTLNAKNIYISTGSACDTSAAAGTKAALAMGMTMEEARQFFRISLSMETTEDEVAALAAALSHAAEHAVML
ncbi:cysteine desulfurase [Domibacillus antri]|uniref:Cysteine desulfurase n=1 Tax=Domibacillus antri TaxID=1714264 RepID=A0A1Q8Q803_9BACI|nr:IscS subfamily cysteine desulfurase [Domibacillus antri]OLN23477.1 cysteine desulfurase [Domibacillus antri]